jgi:hypothetical protein
MPTPGRENDKELSSPFRFQRIHWTAQGFFLMTATKQYTGTQMAMRRASVRLRRIGRPAGLR